MSNNGLYRVLARGFTFIGVILIVIELAGVILSLRYGPVPIGIIQFLLLGFVMLIIGLGIRHAEKINNG